MRIADELTTRPAPPRGVQPCSEICVAGRPTGLRVDGKRLEAAVEIDGRYLVFLTDGVTMEELLSIHLVTADGKLLDSAAVGQMYAPGIFTGLALVPPAQVTFRFLGDVQWRVEVFDAPRTTLPMTGDAPAVKRPFAWRRSFRVRATAAA